MPQISVIVPVYNVERYLERCVKSILAQSFTDFELLLVNDASTDHSLAVAQKFQFDRRVKVLDKPHGGLGDTRNYGAGRAMGKYLLFVDSDDWVEEDMLRDLFALAESYRADMVLFNFIREDLKNMEHRECRLPVFYPDFGREMQERILSELIGPDNSDGPWHRVEMLGCAWRRLYLRSWFVNAGIVYADERKIMLEDLPATIRAHVFSRRVLAVGGCYYHYRYNPDSLSTRYRPHKMEMLTECFLTVRRVLEENGLYEQYRQRHLAWFLRSAAHSSLVNCFSAGNPAGFRGRYREVAEILKSPVLKEAAKSDYLKRSSRADRVVRLVLRTRFTPAVYLFYRLYSAMLCRDGVRR